MTDRKLSAAAIRLLNNRIRDLQSAEAYARKNLIVEQGHVDNQKKAIAEYGAEITILQEILDQVPHGD